MTTDTLKLDWFASCQCWRARCPKPLIPLWHRLADEFVHFSHLRAKIRLQLFKVCSLVTSDECCLAEKTDKQTKTHKGDLCELALFS